MTAQGWGLGVLILAAAGGAVLLNAIFVRVTAWTRLRRYGRRRWRP